MKKKIAVVIVTYNGAFWIKKNIDSLLRSNYPVEIIVVDNASTDNSIALLESFSAVEIIKSETNLGFGKANTIGIKKALDAGADAVFLLNQDTWIFEDTVQKLVERIISNPEFGILSPLHFSGHEKVLDKNFEMYYSKKATETAFQKIATVPFVNAAAWLVSKMCFEKVGYFEPAFDHYGEDRNFCNRVLYHDFKIGIVKDAAICHDRKISRNIKKDTLQAKYQILNRLLNINDSLTKSWFLALQSVVGLPKYFFKYYGFITTLQLFKTLLRYYIENLFKFNKINEIRKVSKKGDNGTDNAK